MSLRPSKALDVRRDGVPITDAAVRHAVSTGVTFGAQLPGLVPEYEEQEAMAVRGLTDAGWLALDATERARIIAYQRVRKYVDLHTQEAITEAQRRKAE